MTIKQAKIYDYLILASRVLIAWTLFRYGWNKLSDNQFGLSNEQLETPIKNLSLFNLAWHLFDQEPFKTFIGVSQIVTGILLIYNRTFLIGVLISIPILLNILIVDITYLKFPGFYWRLSYYLLLTILILLHYRERITEAIKNISVGLTTKFKFPIWAYFILPFTAVGLEILGFIPKFLTNLLINPSETISAMRSIPNIIMESVDKICQ